jgi:hypothetical protein
MQVRQLLWQLRKTGNLSTALAGGSLSSLRLFEMIEQMWTKKWKGSAENWYL